MKIFVLTLICKSKSLFHIILQEEKQQNSCVLLLKLGIFLNGIISLHQIPGPYDLPALLPPVAHTQYVSSKPG